MAFEFSYLLLGLLGLTGIAAGFINTLAGGGSMLTLPVMMMMGMPADIANGTNRVGVLFQSLTAMRGFDKENKLESTAILPMLVPTLVGAIVGAVAASVLPVTFLKPVLLVTMVVMALVMLVKPDMVAPLQGTQAHKLRDKPSAVTGLFLAGVYGGFIQAGVGFILLAALAGGLRYDLVRANALKTVATAVFSGLALAVFVFMGQVSWIPGLVLAVGSMIGAALSVRFAISVSQTVLKWILFIMVSITCAMAMLF